MTAKKPSLTELTKALKGGGNKAVPQLEKMKKTPKEKKAPGTGTWGGAREGSGREPGGTQLQKRIHKQLIEKHVEEEAEVTVTDKKTGVTVVVKKPRILIAMEKLFALGTRGQGDAAALDKWLNRAVGKAVQPIVGDEDEPPVQVDLGIGHILAKVYGNNPTDKGSGA